MNARTWLVLSGLVALVAAQQFFAVPGPGLWAKSIHNFLHVPWFFVVTLALRWWLGRWSLALPIALALGVGTELLQIGSGREASLADAFRNFAGAAIAVMLWQAWFSRGVRGFGLFIAASVFAVGCAWPLIELARAEQHMAKRFPQLLALDHSLGRKLVRPTSPMRFDAEVQALELQITGTTWPGIHLERPVSPWEGFTDLCVDMRLDEGAPIDVFVGLLLKPGDGITAYALRRLPPGRHWLRFPLSDLLPTPEAEVFDVFIYTTGDYAGRQLSLYEVKLD